jgi:DNA-binding response OmpR family regulator
MPGARILLVEDDEVLRGLLTSNLEARGHEVRSAHDARTALAYLRTSPVDLVLLDINLPDQTGWDVLRIAQRHGLLRSQVLGHDTPCFPVVVLSAVRVNPRRLAEFHPLAYLPKPFPMEAVLRLAAEAAGRRNGEVVAEKEDAESYLDEEGLRA